MIKKFKNLLLPIIMVFAFTSPQITQAMDTSEEEKAIILFPNSNLALDVEGYILQIAVKDSCYEFGFAGNLGSVCKAWDNFINKEVKYILPFNNCQKLNLKNYFLYNIFYNGELIYRPNPGSDEGMVQLKISNLEKPLEGKFDLLSACGAAVDAVLSIYTGYRKANRLEKENKIQIWFVLRPEIISELNKKKSLARHFKNIMKNWSVCCPVAIFWTWGNQVNLKWYDYSTNNKIAEINFKNLYENAAGAVYDGWKFMAHGVGPAARGARSGVSLYGGQKFHVHFK